MKFLHFGFNLSDGEIIEVTLDKQANVLLLDDANFSIYQRGGRFSYLGGLAKKSPLVLTPPHPGHWNVVIDRGGSRENVRASVRIIKVG